MTFLNTIQKPQHCDSRFLIAALLVLVISTLWVKPAFAQSDTVSSAKIAAPENTEEAKLSLERASTLASIQSQQAVFLEEYENSDPSGVGAAVISHKLSSENEKIQDALRGFIEHLNDKQTLSEANQATLVSMVEKQLSYLKAREYDSMQMLKDKELETKGTDSSLLSSESFETRSYLVENRYRQFEVYTWLGQLTDTSTEEEQATIKKSMAQMLELTSTIIDFLENKITNIQTQISKASSQEKPSLEEQKINYAMQLDNATNQLRLETKLADYIGIDTSEYKIKLFEIDGKLSEDMFSPSMIKQFSSYFITTFKNWVIQKSSTMMFNLVVAFLLLYLGILVSKTIRSILRKILSKHEIRSVSKLMQNFIISMVGKVIFFIFLLSALSQLGINLKPMLAGLGIAGIVIGFALQDTLANFASGIMLLIYRPFDIGDHIETGVLTGKVGSMSLVNTTIKTWDNQIIIVPNKLIWENTIKNVTHERIRRVDMIFSIGYDDDILLAEEILKSIVSDAPNILKTPECNIRLNTLGESSLDFIVRPWVKTEYYYDVYWFITREVKLRFDAAGLNIPYPQQDVHLHLADDKIKKLFKKE